MATVEFSAAGGFRLILSPPAFATVLGFIRGVDFIDFRDVEFSCSLSHSYKPFCIPDGPVPYWLRFLVTGIFVALIEETFFRGACRAALQTGDECRCRCNSGEREFIPLAFPDPRLYPSHSSVAVPGAVVDVLSGSVTPGLLANGNVLRWGS